MEFPHLSDTKFPYLQNENVYAFQNTFDYSRWIENSRVRLVNVPWNSTYSDVAVFDTDADRDAWFDAIEDGYPITMETAARIVPDGFVKLPVPYDVAAQYNYLYVDIPIATSGNQMIDYETGTGIRRWYFFVDSIDYGSQNSTHLYVRQDVWTNFHNKVRIKYMMLERGHAPVAASDTDTYLSNPISNSEYLLAPDVDFGRGSIVRKSALIPFGNGRKYVVFASMATRANMLQMGERKGTGTNTWTPATFSDSAARDGHHMNIHGYLWGDGYDYSSLRTRTDNGATNRNRIANNVTCWAIPADECFGFSADRYYDSFLVKLSHQCPSFMQTILATFVVDESMLSFNYEPVTICGHELRYCRGESSEVMELALDKGMFSYPERYERFAKLYTYPYASLELTDNEGDTVNVRIEDTGRITYQLITSLAFPFLDMRVLFNGIGGSGSTSYTWTDLVDSKHQIDIGNDDWGSVKFDWPIPTFALHMDGETAYNLRNQADLKNARRDAITGYHLAMRDANCAKNNAIALATTAEANADANADTLVANTANTCNAQTANTAQTVATNNANVALGNSTSSSITQMSNGVATERVNKDNLVSAYTVAQQNETTTSTTAHSGDAAVITGAANGIMGSIGMATDPSLGVGAGLGISAVMGAMGAFSGYVNAKTSKDNAAIVTQAQSAVMAKTTSANSYKVQITNDENDMTTQLMNTLHTDQTTNTNNCLTAQTANNVAAATANASNTSGTMKSNAARTRGTSVSNAGYTQTAAERNAKELLEAAQDKAKNRYESARNAQPQNVGIISGSPEADYFMTRGVQWKVRTESDSAIAQAGDHFARYGYALNRMWDVSESGFCPMPKFCYWKASDIWVDDAGSSDNEVNTTIRRMFLDGMTVWKNPDEIGRVSVYDN